MIGSVGACGLIQQHQAGIATVVEGVAQPIELQERAAEVRSTKTSEYLNLGLLELCLEISRRGL